jgi:gelsolin
VREVPPEGASLVKGDTYVLDRGTMVWQLNTMGSSGKEKFKAAEVAHELAEARKGACNVEVFGRLHPLISLFAYLY